jgi:hypothetical protein
MPCAFIGYLKLDLAAAWPYHRLVCLGSKPYRLPGVLTAAEQPSICFYCVLGARGHATAMEILHKN